MLANARHIGFFSGSGYSPDIQSRSYDEEDKNEGSEIIYAVSEIGVIADFIKAHPMYTVDDYRWNLNPRLIRLMCADNTHIHYLSEKEKKDKKKNTKYYDGIGGNLLNDLGLPVF